MGIIRMLTAARADPPALGASSRQTLQAVHAGEEPTRDYAHGQYHDFALPFLIHANCVRPCAMPKTSSTSSSSSTSSIVSTSNIDSMSIPLSMTTQPFTCCCCCCSCLCLCNDLGAPRRAVVDVAAHVVVLPREQRRSDEL